MHRLHADLQHRPDLAESAVRDHEIDVRLFLQHGNRSGRPKRLSVNSEKCGVRVSFPAVPDHGKQILPFPYGIGAERFFIQAMPAQVVNDHMKSQLKIHPGILHGAEPVIRVPVRDEDIPGGFLRVFQELRVQHVTVFTRYGIILLLQRVIP